MIVCCNLFSWILGQFASFSFYLSLFSLHILITQVIFIRFINARVIIDCFARIIFIRVTIVINAMPDQNVAVFPAARDVVGDAIGGHLYGPVHKAPVWPAINDSAVSLQTIHPFFKKNPLTSMKAWPQWPHGRRIRSWLRASKVALFWLQSNWSN